MSKETPLVDFFNKINPFITTIIAIVAIVIPVAGFSFEQGYLSVFGLSSESFPRDITESWGRSYYVIMLAFVFLSKNYLHIVAWSIGYIVLLSLIVLFILSFFEKEQLRKFFDKCEKIKDSDGWLGNSIYVIECVIRDFKWVYNLILYSFLIFLIAALVLVFPAAKGVEIADEEIKKYKNEKCNQEKWSRCIQIQDLKSNIILYEGLMIASTSKFIALYDGRKTKVIPRLENYSLIRHQGVD